MLANEDDSGLGRDLPNAVGRINSADSRQTDIHKNDVGMERPNRVNRVFAIVQCAHHLDAGLIGQDGANAAPGDLMIIDDNQPNWIHFSV